MNEISQTTELLSVTHNPKDVKTDTRYGAKAMDFVRCAVVRMIELEKSFRATRECAGLAEGDCRE